MTDLDSTLYLIYSGYGRDGGFGDYAGVSWANTPLTLDNEIVWFKNEKTAQETVDRLNEASKTVFYSQGAHDSHDGNFPLEYEYRAIIVPSNPPARTDVFDKIKEQDKEHWNNFNYDPEYEKYEKHLVDHNLDYDELSYDDWLRNYVV